MERAREGGMRGWGLELGREGGRGEEGKEGGREGGMGEGRERISPEHVHAMLYVITRCNTSILPARRQRKHGVGSPARHAPHVRCTSTFLSDSWPPAGGFLPFTHLYVQDIVSIFFVCNGAHMLAFLCWQVIKTPPFGSRAESSLKGNLTALSDQVGAGVVRGDRGERRMGKGRGESDGEWREEGGGREMTKRGSALAMQSARQMADCGSSMTPCVCQVSVSVADPTPLTLVMAMVLTGHRAFVF